MRHGARRPASRRYVRLAKAPYFHRSLVFVPLDTGEAELRHRIEISHAIIRASLTAKLRGTLESNPPQ